MSSVTVRSVMGSHYLFRGVSINGENFEDYHLHFANLDNKPVYVFAKFPLSSGFQIDLKDLRRINMTAYYLYPSIFQMIPVFGQVSAIDQTPLSKSKKRPYTPDVPKSPDEVMDEVRRFCGGGSKARL